MTDADVIVIGGGPAGATAAALLARAGHRVVVFEKDSVPRFHIGESLLPCNQPVFERLGFVPTREDYVRKGGADFDDERSGVHTEFSFDEGLPGTPSHAWHVERSVFDAQLLDIAIRDGADVRIGQRVTEVAADAEVVEVRVGDAVYRARYCLDATGQDAFLARRRRTVDPIRGFGLAAVFCHFHGLSPEAVAELEATGTIKILVHDHGWGWAIPLRGAKLSFGVVSREKGITPEVLERVYEVSPLMRRLTAGANRTEPQVIRNFSFRNREPCGVRWACIGDSAYFLDPVFSSGVALAMIGAECAADLLIAALPRGEEATPDLLAPASAHMDRALETFSALIHSFYHTRIVQHLFTHPDPDPAVRAGLVSVLAGDVWRDDNPFQKMLVGGRRGRASKRAQGTASTGDE